MVWHNRIVGQGVKPASKFVANPSNWRIHPPAQKTALRVALNRLGWIQNVIVNANTGRLIDGHERVEQALENGDADVPFIEVDLTEDEEALALTIIDPISAMAIADSDKLCELVAGLQSEDAEVNALLAEVADRFEIELPTASESETKADPGANLDAAEELRERYGVELGQVWRAGAHRLACGDCRDKQVWERLLGTRQLALGVTSPPYGVGKDYEEKGVLAWFGTVKPAIAMLCQHARVVIWQLADLYATGTQFIEPTFAYSVNMFLECGYRPLWVRVWEKPGINMSVGPYHLNTNKPAQQYEQVAAFSGEIVSAEGADGDDGFPVTSDYEWVTAYAGQAHRFVRRLTRAQRRDWGYAGVWHIPTVAANKEHPAMFPVELPARCILMHSDTGDGIVDPFCGSGTTLVACEQLNRVGYGIELTPKYVAVALDRLGRMGLDVKLERAANE